MPLLQGVATMSGKETTGMSEWRDHGYGSVGIEGS